MQLKYTGDNYYNLKERRKALLSTDKEDIISLYDLFKESIEKAVVAVTASKGIINKNKDLFDEVENIF